MRAAPALDTFLDVERFDDPPEEALARRFANARPFPHVVLEDFLRLDPEELSAFPPPEWEGWQRFTDDYQRSKMACDDISIIPRPFADVIVETSTPRFLRFLERVTGIERLVPDPHLTGGGLHLSGPGGILAPHTDFHSYPRLGLFRRINVLIYLNPGWTADRGGLLELQSRDGRERAEVLPAWGSTVIFRTDHQSVHGFPTPIADGQWRRSIALYFYTSAEAAEFSGDTTTYWRTHGEHRGLSRVRLGGYRALLAGSTTLAKVAHRLNPVLNSGRETTQEAPPQS